MARLSAANSAEHLAALKTPDSRSSKRPSRFKEFFKGGHSRSSMSSGHEASPLGATVPSGVENLKPGFEKVGRHPAERSPTEEVHGVETLKEREEDGDHVAKSELREGDRPEPGDGEKDSDVPMNEWARSEGEKALKVLGFESMPVENDNATSMITATGDSEAAGVKDHISEQEQAQEQACNKDENDVAMADTSDKHQEDSISGQKSSDIVEADSPPAKQPAYFEDFLQANPEIAAHLQAFPLDPNLDIGALSEDESLRAHASSSNYSDTQHIVDPLESPTHRSNQPHTDKVVPQNGAAARVRSSILAKLGASPPTIPSDPKPYKLGPYKLDAFTALALKDSLLPSIYLLILFVKAIQSPSAFFVVVWRFVILLYAYDNLRKRMSWHVDGSSDVILAPVEELMDKVKEVALVIVAIVLGQVAHAIAVGLREMELEEIF